MAGIQIADARAPWINFEARGVEDREESIKQGRYVAKNVDFVLVTPHGSRDRIEREVNDWLSNMAQQVAEGRLPDEWLTAYRRAYKHWKEGQEIPLEGTPIANWPILSPAQVKMLQDLHILTVEVLAEANEETIRRLGMGGRNLVDKAKAWVQQATGPGKVVEDMAALKRQNEALEARLNALEEQNTQLKAQAAAVQANSGAPAASALSIGAADILDPQPKAKRL